MSGQSFEDLANSSDSDVINCYHAQNMVGCPNGVVDSDNDLWVVIFKYPNYKTSKILVFDVRSEKIWSFTFLNGSPTRWIELTKITTL